VTQVPRRLFIKKENHDQRKTIHRLENQTLYAYNTALSEAFGKSGIRSHDHGSESLTIRLPGVLYCRPKASVL